jgi:predicted outer membrane repeat protein
MRIPIALVAFALLASGPALAKPAALCVTPGGTGGCFSSIQDAVDATGKSGSVINIAFGSYFENVTIPKVKLTMNADPNTAIFGNTTDPIFTIAAGAKVTINNLQFQDTITNSACIESRGSLTMKNCAVFLCTGTRGAGIHQVGGKLTMIGSSLDANQATENGGCLAMEGGHLNLMDTEAINCIAGGDGGGLWLSNAMVSINGDGGDPHQPSVQVMNNKAAGSGGGIFARGGKITIKAVILKGNTATSGNGGGIQSTASLTIADSEIEHNNSEGDGGGILAQGPGRLSVMNSSIVFNFTRSDGGGIAAGTTFNLLNDTVFLNDALENGGGISAQASGKIGSTTIDDNDALGSGAGIDIAGGSVKIANTIIGPDSRDSLPSSPDCGGSFASNGFNLIVNASGCSISGQTATNIIGEDPDLAFGQPFDVKIVQKPNQASPVLGAGGHCPKTDEVLHARPRKHCDIGAFESP